MKTEAETVIEHAGGSPIEITVFIGKNRKAEALKHFHSLVFEHLKEKAEENKKPFDAKAMKVEIKKNTGNFDHGSAGDGEFAIYIFPYKHHDAIAANKESIEALNKAVR